MFQFLIGILITESTELDYERELLFQFLIGILITIHIKGIPISQLLVSIPYRYSNNHCVWYVLLLVW